MNQWRNTSSVVKWFQNLPEKNKSQFLKFDIINFYSSITEKLLKNAILFSKKFTAVNDNTIKIILNARKSLLFNSNNPWMKKTGENFDVAMSSFDGAEICELVHFLGGHFFLQNLDLFFQNLLNTFFILFYFVHLFSIFVLSPFT